ncbi:putative porin [Lacimicrobium alkaliphilum]|uniref:Porin n=1 Tax=Lacimicrobium alkaliphilum TaxID=1526571 RepID=A0ABQ1RS92_9ALTE|nr:putative porin [Lacimicrobium alkaliphilum]GGD75543.1 hypothetical protein GCM10011357_33220 [Lacimicrobium alkaliphilum]
MKKINIVLASIVFPSVALAQDYQLFSELGYERLDLDADYADTDIFSASGKYYFRKKQALGPWAEFDFLNTKSNVSAYYINQEGDVDAIKIAGEAFIGNILVGAGYKRSDTGTSSYNSSSATLGYLIQPNLLIKADYQDHPHGGDAVFSARYTHSLAGKDYIGFDLAVDDDFDYWSGSSKYFRALGQNRYLAAEFNINDNDGTTTWGLAGDYYFSQATSVGLGYQDLDQDDSVSVRARHYFTQNWALSASYSSIDENDIDIYQIALIGQF